MSNAANYATVSVYKRTAGGAPVLLGSLDTSTTSTYRADEVAGKKIRNVLDLPLLQSDALLMTESQVT